LAALEAHLLFNSKPSPLLDAILSHRPTFQKIQILHQLFISLTIALGQLGPLLFPSIGQIEDLMKELSHWTDVNASESSILFRNSLQTVDDPVAAGLTQRRIEKVLIDYRVEEKLKEMKKHV
jgi:hypothetical protein